MKPARYVITARMENGDVMHLCDTTTGRRFLMRGREQAVRFTRRQARTSLVEIKPLARQLWAKVKMCKETV
jgi:hypothetical protein